MTPIEMVELCYKYRNFMFKEAKMLEKDQIEAEELVSKVLAELCKPDVSGRFVVGRNEWGVRAFLKKCIYNMYLNTTRKKKIEKLKVAGLTRHLGNATDKNFGGENIDCQLIMKCVNKLPKDVVKIINLRLDGFQYKQIAAKLKMPEGTVKMKVHHGRIQLIEILKRNGITDVQILWFKNEYKSDRSKRPWSEDILDNLFT